MNPAYILLMCTIVVALFCKERKPVYLCIMATSLAGWYQDIIDSIGICSLALFASSKYIYVNFRLNKCIQIVLGIILYTSIVAAMLHVLPGFSNTLVVNDIKLSTLSIPFSMYLNFDKPMVILTAYAMSDLYVLEKKHKISYQQTIKYTLLPYLWSIPLVFIPGYISGCILFDPHLPNILWIWIMNNFFLVCMTEEVIFRGWLQSAIQNGLTWYGYHSKVAAIMLTSLLFGMVHFQGGIIYIVLATMAGFLYGYTYYKTGKILCSMIVHFGVNLLHFLLFTYPMATP